MYTVGVHLTSVYVVDICITNEYIASVHLTSIYMMMYTWPVCTWLMYMVNVLYILQSSVYMVIVHMTTMCTWLMQTWCHCVHSWYTLNIAMYMSILDVHLTTVCTWALYTWLVCTWVMYTWHQCIILSMYTWHQCVYGLCTLDTIVYIVDVHLTSV